MAEDTKVTAMDFLKVGLPIPESMRVKPVVPLGISHAQGDFTLDPSLLGKPKPTWAERMAELIRSGMTPDPRIRR